MKIPNDFMEQAIKNVLEEYGLTEDMSLKDCVEKQIAKKPIYSRLYATTPNMNCSVCGKTFISEYPKPKYCSVCGQKLDWSDEE